MDSNQALIECKTKLITSLIDSATRVVESYLQHGGADGQGALQAYNSALKLLASEYHGAWLENMKCASAQ